MDSPTKKTLQLDHLGCANCAARIEDAVRRIDGVRDASVDFATQRITLEFAEPSDAARILAQVRTIATRIEPDIDVVDPDGKLDERDLEIERAGGVDGHAAGGVDRIDHDGAADWRRLVRPARLALGTLLFALAAAFGSRFAPPLERTLFVAAYLLIGIHVLYLAIRKIVLGQVFDEHFLMSLATLGAFAIGEFPEAVAVMLFYEAGELLEDKAVDRSRRSIGALTAIRPDHANLKRGSTIVPVAPEGVPVGETIVIKPGERVPLDGRIIEGTTFLDTSAITGEPVPRRAAAGDDVYSGSINQDGLIVVQTTRTFDESTVSRILELVQNAAGRKAPTERFITRFARRYTPVVVLAALLLAVVPPLVLPGARFSDWLYRALAFLVVSCPCALVISIPLGYFGGIGAASRRGILVKGGNYLEALRHVDTVVFDKTGTLTHGDFQVTRVQATSRANLPENAILRLAAHAEAYSDHPIARSIVRSHVGDIDLDAIAGYHERPGQGVRATIAGQEVIAGNAAFLSDHGIAAAESGEAGTVVHVAVDGYYAGWILVADTLKPDAADAIRQLKALGVDRTVLLTGDVKPVGERIARDLGIDEAYAELLPARKVEQLETLVRSRRTRGRIAFVGDGVNDAPALARADIGIAMGALGSDAAIEAADVVIMTDRPSKVAEAIRIARRTNRIVWQNIGFAFAVKAIVLTMSAAGLASMWEAVFADMGVALLAILNATRIFGDSRQGHA